MANAPRHKLLLGPLIMLQCQMLRVGDWGADWWGAPIERCRRGRKASALFCRVPPAPSLPSFSLSSFMPQPHAALHSTL
eukprot:1159401-Pelagomonas_calceolata.AAC.4